MAAYQLLPAVPATFDELDSEDEDEEEDDDDDDEDEEAVATL